MGCRRRQRGGRVALEYAFQVGYLGHRAGAELLEHPCKPGHVGVVASLQRCETGRVGRVGKVLPGEEHVLLVVEFVPELRVGTQGQQSQVDHQGREVIYPC